VDDLGLLRTPGLYVAIPPEPSGRFPLLLASIPANCAVYLEMSQSHSSLQVDSGTRGRNYGRGGNSIGLESHSHSSLQVDFERTGTGSLSVLTFAAGSRHPTRAVRLLTR
jgi:hypothetical protein